MKIEIIKDFVQSANINFLIGSGLSCPYLSTLKDIESRLTELSNNKDIKDPVRTLLQASIYKEYYEKVILPNCVICDQSEYNSVIDRYKNFISVWNSIIHNRCGNLRTKQINVFSTNIDVFFEKASELCEVELNDGFKGSVSPIFNEANFQKSVIKNSVHFQNCTELPVFNLLKMHGSINWQLSDDVIRNDYELHQVLSVKNIIDKLDPNSFIQYKGTFDSMIDEANDKIYNGFKVKKLQQFNEEYNKFIMVNPTKHKFSETVMDSNFYELMRLFSNALEKENSLLFVMGFSFADEHILKITLRALQNNPTLMIIIFAHKDEDVVGYQEKFSHNSSNVVVLSPTIWNNYKDAEDTDKILEFNFDSINSIYNKILKLIPVKFDYGN